MRTLKGVLFFLGLLFGYLAAAQGLQLGNAPFTGGQTLQLTYHSAGTALERAKELKVLVYTYDTSNPRRHAEEIYRAGWVVHEVWLQESGQVYKATYDIPLMAEAMIIVVSDSAEKIKDGPAGEAHFVYRANHSMPSVMAMAELAEQLYSPNIEGVLPDKEKGLALIRETVKKYPDALQNLTVFNIYYSILLNADKETYTPEVKKIIADALQQKVVARKELMILQRLSGIMRDKGLAGTVYRRELKDYGAEIPAARLYPAIIDEKNKRKKKQLLEQLMRCPNNYIPMYIPGSIFQHLISGNPVSQSGWDLLEHYADTSRQNTMLAGGLNRMVADMLEGSLEEKGEYTERAIPFAQRALKIITEEILNPDPADKNPALTLTGYRNSLLSDYADILAKNALIQYRLGNYELALQYGERSLNNYTPDNLQVCEVYALAVAKVKGEKAAEQILAKMIQQGWATTSMKKDFEKLFLQNNSLADAYGKYMYALEEKLYEKQRLDLAAKMLSNNEKAPLFSLKDMKGNTVNLADLKGKVVILDFWATWCGACVANLPAMQMAVDQLKTDNEVVFLFINTKEGGADPLKKINSFLQKTGYTFTVLYDADKKSFLDYGLYGIPTQIFIDKQGMIAYKNVGNHSSSAEEEVRKIEILVEMIKSRSAILNH